MSASSMNVNSHSAGGKEAISLGDVVWLHAMRNSPVSRTVLFQTTKQKVLNTIAPLTGLTPVAR